MSWLQKIWRFVRFLAQRMLHDRCFEAAGALAFTTILALVPLGAVSLALVSAFPGFEPFKKSILDFGFAHFVPSSAAEVQNYLISFFDHAAKLTFAGILMLILSAVLMMNSIEGTFNRIWRAPTARPTVARFVVFWTALTMGPLLIAASLGVSAFIFSLPLISNTARQWGLEHSMLRMLPLIIEVFAFSASYYIVPHRLVRFRHAIIGGVVAAILFEFAKRGFAWYLRTFPATTEIYGALSAIPIFFLWIYILWLIVLLGAELASALGAFKLDEIDKRILPADMLKLTMCAIGHLREARLQGVGLSAQNIKDRIEHLTDDATQEILRVLADLKVVQRSEDGFWLLSRDLPEISVGELVRHGEFALPSQPILQTGARSWELALDRQLAAFVGDANRLLSMPLAQFLR
jgi:membrane protein